MESEKSPERLQASFVPAFFACSENQKLRQQVTNLVLGRLRIDDVKVNSSDPNQRPHCIWSVEVRESR